MQTHPTRMHRFSRQNNVLCPSISHRSYVSLHDQIADDNLIKTSQTKFVTTTNCKESVQTLADRQQSTWNRKETKSLSYPRNFHCLLQNQSLTTKPKLEGSRRDGETEIGLETQVLRAANPRRKRFRPRCTQRYQIRINVGFGCSHISKQEGRDPTAEN